MILAKTFTLALVAACALVGGCGEGPPAAQQPGNEAEPNTVAKPNALDPMQARLLQSQAVQSAIHRALTTGENQRWQDEELSGYAVPSTEALPNGCKTIRYTVDQQPDGPMMTINACEGSR